MAEWIEPPREGLIKMVLMTNRAMEVRYITDLLVEDGSAMADYMKRTLDELRAREETLNANRAAQ